ncbi:ABC transporter ATP-binding protein [Nocardia terpenica]|uniref:ABC transporter domain-containing protein n=1 Tax=Nocardia terpenica TaxID=455432 RepID=A0A161Z7K2_9NOCA|nr:ATP-binding cassette domain-containing protein [Nocardia terpenica]KZM76154.1 hypothetical protein AWN90_00010 [Nocardia terpenica]NQE90338.1 ABC transporter ATP-binding protein [Nocardia terpenica]
MIAVDDFSVRAPNGTTLLAPLSLRVPPGSITALTGPSGCGKSTLMKALLGQVPSGATVAGAVRVGGHDVLALDAVGLRRFRREEIAFVGQDPGVALNPTMRVRTLLEELADARRAREALAAVELPESYLRRRPAELSGGEQRRIALARALARRTPILVLDEPLAGLHGRLRSAVVRLLRDLVTDRGTTIVVSGHDTAALRELADDHVAVASAPLTVNGVVVPDFPPELFDSEHTIGAPDTRDAPPGGIDPEAPRRDTGSASHNAACSTGQPKRVVDQVLSMSGVTVSIGRRPVLTDIGLEVTTGESLAITGPSGAGKSTLARAVVGLRRPVTGTITATGQLALVPQDSAASLNPRRTIAQTLGRPLRRRRGISRAQTPAAVADLLRTVELDPALAHRYPHELSGGQRQRVALARALALDPAVLVCDEITSALDHDTAAAIMTLLDRLRRTRDLALLVITHDMDLVGRYCTRMEVLEAGRIVESGPVADLLAAPSHDATLALLG